METIAILGTGLMGSSLGLALRKRGAPVRIHAYARRPATREAALNLGIADAVFSDPAEAVRGADIVVLCVPVLTIPKLAKACRAGLKPGVILTDVGSTKACLNKLMAEALAGTGAEFIGSHPICGSEQQGIEAGNADLYEGAMTVVTPPPLANESGVAFTMPMTRGRSSLRKRPAQSSCGEVSNMDQIPTASLVVGIGRPTVLQKSAILGSCL